MQHKLVEPAGLQGVVLDLFGGSGSTLIAAHKTSRRARLCELDPVYCDRILHRWEVFAKDDAERSACGLATQQTADQGKRGVPAMAAKPSGRRRAAARRRRRRFYSRTPRRKTAAGGRMPSRTKAGAPRALHARERAFPLEARPRCAGTTKIV
jgi:hypothetical protein